METWIDAVSTLRSQRRAAVLLTVTAVRGHAPREAGAKMVISADETFGSVGGGNLEMAAIARARQLIGQGSSAPETMELRLNDKAPATYGRQCCGGEIKLLLEPLPVPETVAIFGLGHVGMELARILSRHPIDLYLTDSRPEAIEAAALLQPSVATIHAQVAVMGEQVLGTLPEGSHVLIMTHDHAEDFHLSDAALRYRSLGSIGLIGSKAKWARFRKNLRDSGHSEQEISRIQCPIGIPEVAGKQPAVIAVSVAAQLMQLLGDHAERSAPGNIVELPTTPDRIHPAMNRA
ncbi:xanthine dehydrogenase accessory protein XdhC [Glutamicibacter halophytocola]|uniref:Xanthine dehydrogenase accessory protein XdhC n=1 Tax=Glutamicibacter halophytocola TaxID=1933880 RepID=A0ABX5Y9T8_9MICC|nr:MULTISPECIES: xanthine dehydrogenase accessory protein XdhC [Glutamicibacter]MBF6670668.1 xanthine dehydrogenase accessory protein XdhC [Glutamicibacter sp. FBE19]QDY66432.1 xanthine dehydrogenase accessory protein XdhC [Glutamicibacter halophytocola]